MDEKRWVEGGWLSQAMVSQLSTLGYTRTKSGKRKLRLFATECCRRCWDFIPDVRLKQAVEVAERFADGLADKAELANTFAAVTPLRADRTFPNATTQERVAVDLAVLSCHQVAYSTAFMMTCYANMPLAANDTAADKLLGDLLRCVFGNPFQKPAFNKKWRSETVTALASGIYADHAFDRLPILADALEEAGCDDPAMLTHLRGTGPHCRGCWVLDLALGK